MKIRILAAIVFLSLISGCDRGNIFYTPRIEAGQVWVYESSDPWEEQRFSTNTVLEVKNGWVRFKTNRSDSERTLPKNVFAFESERIK